MGHDSAGQAIRVEGELTFDEAASVSDRLLGTRAGAGGTVVVDPNGVTYLNEHGIAALVRSGRTLASRGVRLRTRCEEAAPAAQRLRMTGLAFHAT